MLLRFETRVRERRLRLTMPAVIGLLWCIGIVMKAQNNEGDVGRPSSCNAFAIATLSVFEFKVVLNISSYLSS